MNNPPETYFNCKAAFMFVPLLPAALPVGTHRFCLALYRCLASDEGTLPDAPLQLLPKCLRYVAIRITVANQQRDKSRSRSTSNNSSLFLEAQRAELEIRYQTLLIEGWLEPARRLTGVKVCCSPVAIGAAWQPQCCGKQGNGAG